MNDPTPQLMSIGELVERTGVSARTIRYYEDLGILPAAQRTPKGTRRYSSEYVFYVEGVEAMKDFGFTLDELAELGHWFFAKRKNASRALRSRAMIGARVEALEHRIAVLERVRDELARAMSATADPEEPIHLAFARASRARKGG
jgi:MerR family gold-responsive transcriptional activator of gol and ges genes